MKAIRVTSAGGPEVLVLDDVPKPAYGPDDVLIELKASGINFIDVYFRKGLYKPESYPYTPGKEGSGNVVAVGKNVKDIHEGDRVVFCLGGSGSYAEYVSIHVSQVVVIPAEMSYEIAAAVMLQGITAYYLSHYTFALNQCHTALVHAGAGGVGLLLIQIAKLKNAKVITTVSTEAKANLARRAGADEVVLYTKDSFLDAVMKFTKDQGVNVVYDAIGKTTFTDSMKSLAIRGMLASYGQASGPIDPIPMLNIAEKSLFVSRPNLKHYIRTRVELMTMCSALFDWVVKEKLHVTIGQRYSLADAQQAHIDLQARKTVGKSILII
jgi:NADPH2:quinone reductase